MIRPASSKPRLSTLHAQRWYDARSLIVIMPIIEFWGHVNTNASIYAAQSREVCDTHAARDNSLLDTAVMRGKR
jgi:hypothetical protein